MGRVSTYYQPTTTEHEILSHSTADRRLPVIERLSSQIAFKEVKGTHVVVEKRVMTSEYLGFLSFLRSREKSVPKNPMQHAEISDPRDVCMIRG